MFILITEQNKEIYKKNQKTSFSVIRKSTLEWVVLISLTIFSFINSFTLLIFLILLLLLLKQKEIGAIKILNLITLRTIINPGIATDISTLQNIKWIIIFFCSFYLMKSYYKLDKNQRLKIRKVTDFVILFTIYNFITALIFSSLPTVAIFKLSSYAAVFLAVFIGISYTHTKIDWINWSYKQFLIFMIFSIPLIVSPVGYLRNGHAFQGLTNQPNMLGIVISLFIGVLLTALQNNSVKYNFYTIICIITFSMWMILLSKSRTAFVTSLVLLLLYIICANLNKLIKIICINILIIFSIALIIFEKSFTSYISDFIYKGQDSILYSRTDQVDELVSNFWKNPLFGNGFSVPVLPYRTFYFSSEFIVEPGNLIIAVLSFSGIIGFFIFIIYITRLLLINIINFGMTGYLPIAIILISMGEMVFFSSNNIGIWCYMFLGMYVYTSNQTLLKDKEAH